MWPEQDALQLTNDIVGASVTAVQSICNNSLFMLSAMAAVWSIAAFPTAPGSCFFFATLGFGGSCSSISHGALVPVIFIRVMGTRMKPKIVTRKVAKWVADPCAQEGHPFQAK